MRIERGLGFLIDHRTDIGGQFRRIADAQRLHRPGDHLQHRIRDIILDQQHAERRAALAGALERRGDHVARDLLGQRR